MRTLMLTLPFVALAGCGSGVTGEIGKACIAADRSAATARLCSCVQAAANRHLNGRDQELAATFFAEPDLAQEIRARDDRASEAFWQRYKDFSRTAERSCRG